MTDPTAMARELLDKNSKLFGCPEGGAILAIIEARRLGFEEGREASVRVADEREDYCSKTKELPGMRHDDKNVWEQRRNESRTIAAAIRALKLEE